MTRAPRTPASATPRKDEGFTLVEVTVVMVVLMFVLSGLFVVLSSLMRSHRRTDALVNNEEVARTALTALAKDVRASNPLLTFTTKDEYKWGLQLTLNDGTSPATTVRWVYDTNSASSTYQQLRREQWNGTAWVKAGPVLRRVRNIETNTPVFSYYSQSGKDLVNSSSPSYTAADVGNCAINVHVFIRSDSDPGPEPFEVQIDAELRNRLPGGVGCG